MTDHSNEAGRRGQVRRCGGTGGLEYYYERNSLYAEERINIPR